MTLRAAIPLGPFELYRPIGRGGMAEVWEGRHIRQDVPIALKVITARKAHNAQFLAAFRNEIRAVAALNHPGIVMVFDYGTVSDEAATRSKGRLVADSPYLAMELATGGSLVQVREQMRWRDIKQILRALLDALSHAHARGVIHRDLKPGNILRSTVQDVRPGIKLTDFGLAHALELQSSEVDSDEIVGTPQYMAPEQFEGRWRDFGPWTDLYALGCVAFELTTGIRPFDGRTFWEIFHAHRDGPPRLVPTTPVPSGFEEWILRLLAPSPLARFQRAADAAWALLRLGDPEDNPVITPLDLDPDLPEAHTENYPDGWLESIHTHTASENLDSDILFGVEADEESIDTDIQRHRDEVPRLPEFWRRPESITPSPQLIGAGLGLYGLRSIPLIGRSGERDILWDELRSVQEEGSARLVMLDGPAGVGKSRLVEWIGERAHELGGASILKATHSPLGGDAEGLPRMVAHHTRCLGLSRGDALDRCCYILQRDGVTDSYEWHALTELMYPSSDREDKRAVRFSSPNQRYVLLRRLIERIGRKRPVIIWLDDVQWGADALEFAHYMLKVQRHAPTPVLMLLTVQEDALLERDAEASIIEEIMARPAAQRVSLAPLGPRHHAELIGRLLGLEGHLAADVTERTAGNPLFAIQLVGDWVQRGVLQVCPTGFVLRQGEQAVIPDDIHTLWTRRIDRFLEQRPDADRHGLELAAALGHNVSEREWFAAAEQLELSWTEELCEDMAAVGLGVIDEGEWHFIHNMLRESLARSAAEDHRWQDHNLACASMLPQLYPKSPKAVADRLGRHLMEGGRFEAALAPLLQGAEVATTNCQHRRALHILESRQRAMEALDAEPSDPRWGQNWLAQAQCSLEEGKLSESAQLADQVGRAAHKFAWSDLLPEALRLLGHAARQMGNLKRSKACFVRALELFEKRADNRGIAGCLRGLGDVERQSKNPEEAESLYERALEISDSIGDRLGMANCLQGLGIIARQLRQFSRSRQLYEEAQELFESIGYQHGVVLCRNSTAEVARYQGNHEEAREGYEAALTRAVAIGSSAAVLARLNLGLVLLEDRQFGKSERLLFAARNDLLNQGRRGLLGALETLLLPCLAWRGDWLAWDEHIDNAKGLLRDTSIIDADIAGPAQLAGELALKAGQTHRAREAFEIALKQWQAMDDPDRIAELLVILKRLPDSNPSET